MADEGGNRKGLVAAIVLLALALLVVVVLWQREEESDDLEIEFDTGDAGAAVEPAPPLARGLPEGMGLSVA